MSYPQDGDGYYTDDDCQSSDDLPGPAIMLTILLGGVVVALLTVTGIICLARAVLGGES